VLLVTHDREEAFEMADRIGVISGGRLQQVGSPQDLLLRPQTVEVARLVCDACLLPAGREGVFLVREDEVSLHRDEAGEGVVEKRVFRGPDYVVHVRLSSGALVRSRCANGSSLSVGERVRVQLSENLWVVPEKPRS
jgi:ABC-type Fe3+/spermidine/putrescine transport system ATPase subunit